MLPGDMFDQATAKSLATQYRKTNRHGHATPDTFSSSATFDSSGFDFSDSRRAARTPPTTPTTPTTPLTPLTPILRLSSIPSPSLDGISHNSSSNGSIASIIKPRAKRKDLFRHLPPVIEEGNPMLDYPASSWARSMIGQSGRVYRFGARTIYRGEVTPREAKLTEAAAAGGNTAMRVLSRIIWKGSRPDTGTKALLIEMGRRLQFAEVVGVERRHHIIAQMFRLLERLHNDRGIVHGDIKESNFVWASDGTLRLVDFSSARFVDEPHDEWNSSFVSEEYLSRTRLEKREAMRAERGNAEGQRWGVAWGMGDFLPPPTVFDDYFALAVTLWGMYTGKRPARRQFNGPVIWQTDLDLFPDTEVDIRNWIEKVLRMAGCNIISTPTYRAVFPEPVERGEDEVVGSVEEAKKAEDTDDEMF